MNKLIKFFFFGIGIVIILFVFLSTIVLSSISDPHTYYNLSNMFLENNQLSIASYFAEKGIEKNTIENLKQAHPKMSESGINHQRDIENSRLITNHAWIQFLQNKQIKSSNSIRKAAEYFEKYSINYNADFLIRFGIIEYFKGDTLEAWNSLVKSLQFDSDIENKNEFYLKYLKDIIRDKTGNKSLEISKYIFNLRKEFAIPAPKLILKSNENIPLEINSFSEKVKFIMFFSPTCGSCRMEIPNLTQIFNLSNTSHNFRFIFILNRPELYDQAQNLLNESGFDKALIYTVKDKNAYDFIAAEPCSWIVDKYEKIRFQHLGYSSGDEEKIYKEIKMLLKETES